MTLERRKRPVSTEKENWVKSKLVIEKFRGWGGGGMDTESSHKSTEGSQPRSIQSLS